MLYQVDTKMGNALKRAQRAKRKAKENRLEKSRRKYYTNLESLDMNDHTGDILTPNASTIALYTTLPCPEEYPEECLSRVRAHVSSTLSPSDEDEVLIGVTLHMQMYKKWRATGDAAIVISP